MSRFLVALLGIFLALETPALAQNSCSFDYVADDGLLKTAFSELPAGKADADLMSVMRRMLPNVHRVFDADRHYAALIGWSELSEDYSKYTDMQAERTLVQGAEQAKRTGKIPAEGYKYETDFGPPITATYTMDYIDGGKPYRDVAMDVIATNHCLFSIKISGARAPNDDAAWADFANEYRRIKGVINEHEGPVAYSREGRSFSKSGLLNNLIYVGIGVVVAVLVGWTLRRRYQIEPGRAARIYSGTIAILSLVMLGFLALLLSGDGPNFETYDGFTPIFLVFVVHVIAFIRRSPTTVLTAMSLMIGLLISRTIYTAMGWLALPRMNETIWLLLSLALLCYAIAGTVKKTRLPANA